VRSGACAAALPPCRRSLRPAPRTFRRRAYQVPGRRRRRDRSGAGKCLGASLQNTLIRVRPDWHLTAETLPTREVPDREPSYTPVDTHRADGRHAGRYTTVSGATPRRFYRSGHQGARRTRHGRREARPANSSSAAVSVQWIILPTATWAGREPSHPPREARPSGDSFSRSGKHLSRKYARGARGTFVGL
jgi:hypothetical protein